MPGVRDCRAAAVTHRDLDRGAVHSPGDLKAFSGQRIRMQDRIAQEFADDESGVSDGVIEDADRAEFIGKSPAGEGDAGRRARQVDDSRRAHLPSHPPLPSRHDTFRAADFRCPDWRWRKPAEPEALIATGARTPARTGVVAAHFQASKALRLRDHPLN